MTTSRASDLNLLMVHADDHAPVLADGLAESTACGQSIPTQSDEASHFWDEDGDPNATVESVADWLTQFYVDHSTTGTKLDKLTDLVTTDASMARRANSGLFL